MDAASAFQVLNAAVMPWWILWIAVPRSVWSGRVASHGGIFVALGVIYTVLLVAALAGAPPGGGGFDFDSLRESLASPIGFLAGWSHYLAFDLFVGAWIVRESTRIEVDPRIFLFFTLMAGPLGLAGFLLRRGVRLRSLGGLGELPAT